ncbi:hypothetical protein SAMN05216573_102481 [Bradyrhizobium sp. Rc3b]|uniref:hypothetical protein n=1 Tax=unclassified Bradyrhizobium TaxID=2631580 RepID=UPI0008E1EFBE|nr:MULTISPECIES: hypothetical protein [unclassified Bradyrhizobium]MBB4381083.1 hypothetical protein [Bradyrhizobium sp. SBR1B]SFM55455.1 hypothetical protein SAMN05216573_102481 [Bradyrhizobium sp. Rc3b]
MAGDEGIAKWIVERLQNDQQFTAVNAVGGGYLEIVRKDHSPFTAAAIGIRGVVLPDHVAPLFGGVRSPQFVVNVPSKVIWSGPAIGIIHGAPAAFGTLGELGRAARDEDVSSYRHREYKFFERAFEQHGAVRAVERLYDRVFKLHRYRGLKAITVVLVDAYDMSAEDVRNARETYGRFDAAVKISSYGSITTAAKEAAASMEAEAFKFGDLMGRLNKA